MSLHRLVALGMIAVALAGCTGVTRSRTKMPAEPDSGSTPPQWTADKPFEARRQDFVECLARASQAARSIASGARDRATRAAVSPMWEEVWIRYLDSHVDLAHDQRQAPIRMVIDQELAAIHEHINWDACAS